MKKTLLMLVAVAIALDMYQIYLVCFALLLLINEMNNKFNYGSILVLLLAIVFVMSFAFKADALFLPNPLLSITKYIVILSMMFYFAFFTSVEERRFFFTVFCLSMIINGLIIIYYSYFLSLTTSSYFGYGRLFNPIHNVDTISPKIALSILAPLISYCLLSQPNRVALILILTLSIYAFVFVQSRISIVISVIIFLTLLYYEYSKLKPSIKILLAFSCLIIISGFMLDYNYTSFDFSDNRLVSSGLESKRFLHWKDGLNKIIDHPFGGFKVDPNIEHVNYFHNIIIDSARIYGWFAIFLIVSIFTTQVYIIYKYNRKNITRLVFVFVFLTLIMMQDVVIEGNFLLLALSLFISFLSCHNTFGEKNVSISYSLCSK
ncbi:O-antigen ligase family protein [Vibrio alginolyticus]|uniref:O-antigen ligase family protein n=1 Tax=Vibrio alginolyticus TaxID=663 RepID=UPI0040688DA5